MGCASSRLDASDVILQCKERRKAIKQAVNCRQDFAIAHVTYIQTLRNVGLALRRFSEGEVIDTSPRSPSTPMLPLPEVSHPLSPLPALSPPRPSLPPNAPLPPSAPSSPPAVPSPPVMTTAAIPKATSPPSPPLLVSTSPPQSSRASRASRFSQSSPPPLTQVSSPPGDVMDMPPPPYSVNGMGSPDRASDFSPPFYSPGRDDADDYFMSFSPSQHVVRSPPPMPSPSQNPSSWFMYDIFDAPPIPYNLLEQRRRRQGVGMEDDFEEDVTPEYEQVRKEEGIPDLEEEEPKEEEKVEKVIPNQGLDKEEEAEEKVSVVAEDKKSVFDEKPEVALEISAESPTLPASIEVEPAMAAASPAKEARVTVLELAASPKRELAVQTSGAGRDLKGAVKHIHRHFATACKSGKDVSGMLETQMVYHLGLLDSKDSSKGFNAITSHWSHKSSLAMRDAYEDTDAVECGMLGSHASTLERLYAWEKKLYDEVKAGEMIRMSFDRKCQQLYNLDSKGGDPVAIDKTRAALKKLDTRLIVALRAIHLASMRVQQLTNEELFPQLAELLGGLMSMWKVMWECHKAQAAIAAEMQTLENSVAGAEASEAHIKATNQLEQELEKWQTHFQRWITTQKNYIDSLHMWLKHCQFEPERDSRGRAVSPHWSEKPPIFYLLSRWRSELVELEKRQRVVDAISDFAVVVHSLEIEQAGELDLKKNAEKSARELDYSQRSLKRLETKYIEYKEDTGASGPSNMQLKRVDLDSRKSLVESEKRRHMEVMLDRQEKTLSRFRQHLPAVFESMAAFAKEALRLYESLQQQNKSPVRENGMAHHVAEDD